MRIHGRRGVTLIEMLITVIIGSIAMLALVPPFMSERTFWNRGKRQTEAQRDAQMVLRAMARVARESGGYDASVPGAVTFTNAPTCVGGPVTFQLLAGGVFQQQCGANPPAILIDGVRSKVTSFTRAPIIANKLVQINLTVTHQLRLTDPNTESENLVTELFLRNG